MKKHIVNIILVVLAFSLVFSSASFAAVTATEQGAVTINNAKEADTFAAYKILDIGYDATTNTLTYEINDAFAAFFTQESVTIETFMGWTDNSDEIKGFFARLDVWLAEQNPAVSAAATATANNAGVAAFGDLDMGYYYLTATSSVWVYSVMTAKVVPTADSEGAYELLDYTLAAKAEQLTIQKEVVDYQSEGYYVGDKIDYIINTSMPTYPVGATEKKYIISDTMDAALTYNNDAAVYGVTTGSADTLLTAGTEYTVTNAENLGGKTFILVFDYDEIKTYDGIKVVYSANINENAITGKAINNIAELTYSRDPYTGEDYTIDTTGDDLDPQDPPVPPLPPKPYVYGVRIFKQETGSAGQTPLQNAKFDIYRPATTAEIAGDDYVLLEDENDNTLYGVKLNTEALVTAADGYVEYDGISAGTYYLVETAAPASYNRIDYAIVVTFTASQTGTDDTAADYGEFNVTVENSQGFILPVTGGSGTVWFTVCGIAVIGIALVILFVTKKKSVKA